MRNRETVSRRTRRTRFGLVITIGLGAFALSASPALAQVATMPKVKSGQTVWVTGADGTTIKGKVNTIAATGLQLKDGDRLTSLPLTDIRRIEVRDSLRNGAIIGAIPTALLFGLGAGTVSAYDCILSPGCNDNTPNRDAVIGLVVGAGIGALIGAGIDRAIPGRRVLYRAPGSAATLTLAPVLSPRGAGARMSLRW